MNWFQGAIADAVSESKIKNAIFVVFVEGKDETTQKLIDFINEEKIRCKLESEHFVAIKIESDSESYMQFAKIYQVVPVPSIFFIGRHGTPLEVGTGVMENAEELERKIDNVLSLSEKNTPSELSTISTLVSEQSLVSTLTPAQLKNEKQLKSSQADELNESSSSSSLSTELYCDGNVCYKKPKDNVEKTHDKKHVETLENETVAVDKVVNAEKPIEEEAKPTNSNTSTAVSQSTGNTAAAEATVELKLEETRKILEKKRLERVEQEKKLEKERELKRRQEGKDTQNAQLWQKEQELKDLKETIRRDRQVEKETRERIRAQIAGDRAERAQKYESLTKTNTTPTLESAQPITSADSTRIQFRLPNGLNKSNVFKCNNTIAILRAYVKTELLTGTGIKEFTLATAYPKREFTTANDEQNLEELGLFPSAVILVIGKESGGATAIIQRSGGLINICNKLFWTMITPLMAIFTYLRTFRQIRATNDDDANVGAQKRAADDLNQEAAKRRNLDRYLTNLPTTSRSLGNDISAAGGSAGTTANNTTDNDNSKAYRRYGSSNIHRLSDNRKDSDDENATWNGNSTQQQ